MRALIVLLLVATTSVGAIFQLNELTPFPPKETTGRIRKSMASSETAHKDAEEQTVFWDFTTGEVEKVSVQTYQQTQYQLIWLALVLCCAATTTFIIVKTALMYWKVRIPRRRNARNGYTEISVIRFRDEENQ